MTQGERNPYLQGNVENFLGKQYRDMFSCVIKGDFMDSCEFDLYDCLEFSYDDIGVRKEKKNTQ